MTNIISENIEVTDRIVSVDEVIVGERYRKLNEQHVKDIMESFERMGGQLQIQPIVVDQDMMLVDGAHRLEAAKRSGWTHIRAMELQGVGDRDREILEIEANRVRLDFSPAELENAWTRYYEPVLKEKASEKKQQTQFAEDQNAVIRLSNNREAERISVRDAAKQITGKSLEVLNQVREIRETAEDESLPEALRSAAVKGLEKLSVPGASVAPVYNSLVSMKKKLEQQQKSPEQLREEHLFNRMNALVETTTGIAMRLSEDLMDDVAEAARRRSTDLDDLRASRNALVTALAKLMAVEAAVADHAGQMLYQLGSEVSQRISEIATEELEARLERD